MNNYTIYITDTAQDEQVLRIALTKNPHINLEEYVYLPLALPHASVGNRAVLAPMAMLRDVLPSVAVRSLSALSALDDHLGNTELDTTLIYDIHAFADLYCEIGRFEYVADNICFEVMVVT